MTAIQLHCNGKFNLFLCTKNLEYTALTFTSYPKEFKTDITRKTFM